MIPTSIICAIFISTIPYCAAASEQSKLKPDILPQACEVSLALSAAPDYLQEDAGIRVLTESGYVTIRDSQNGFTCIVNRDDPRVLKPTCFDRVGTKSVIPKIEYVGSRLVKGDLIADINADLARKFAEGTFVSQSGPGVAYMLSRYNRPVIAQSGQLGFFPPHVMFHAPNLTNADIGHNMAHHDLRRPLPMIAYGGPQGYMIMISDDGAPRQRSDLHSSCPDWIWEE